MEAMVPRSVRGTYLVVDVGQPVYVGRSNAFVQRRLLRHAAAGLGSHFLWKPGRSELGAYLIEAWWFHRLGGTPGFLNVINPTRPGDAARSCPFC